MSLIAAVRNGDLARLQQLVAAGADLEESDSGGYTPLMLALCHHREALARRLIEAGARLDARSFDSTTPPGGQTVLMCAIGALDDLLFERGVPPPISTELVQSILRTGVSVDAPDSNGCTALFYCRERNDMADLLIKSGANVEHRDNSGRTPLMAAARCGAFDTLTLLVRHGAAVNARSDDGTSPLLEAISASAWKGPAAALFLLTQGADPNSALLNGHSALMRACGRSASSSPSYDSTPIVQQLLRQGASVNAQGGYYNRTALMEAAFAGNHTLVDLLLEAGADRDRRDREGKAALDLISPQRQPQVAARLCTR